MNLKHLQEVVNYKLSSEEFFTAKHSLDEIDPRGYISMVELIQVWRDAPVLGKFAEHLRQVYLLIK